MVPKFFEKLCGKLQKVQQERESSGRLIERGVGPPPQAAMSMSTSTVPRCSTNELLHLMFLDHIIIHLDNLISAPNSSVLQLGPSSYFRAGDLANFPAAFNNLSMGNLHHSRMQSTGSIYFSDFTGRSSTSGAVSMGWAQPQPPRLPPQYHASIPFLMKRKL